MDQQWNSPEDAALNPPTMGEALDDSPRKWPIVIGVISLIYAIGGMLCQVGIASWLVIGSKLPEQFRAGMKVPPSVQIVGLAQNTLTFALGVLMLVGAVSLLRRRRSGVSALRSWGFLRIIMIVVGIVITVLTAPAQIQMQRDVVEWQKRYFEEHNIKQEVPEYSDEQLWRKVILSGAISSAIFAIYPTFMVFYLSRKKIDQQIREWRG